MLRERSVFHDCRVAEPDQRGLYAKGLPPLGSSASANPAASTLNSRLAIAQTLARPYQPSQMYPSRRPSSQQSAPGVSSLASQGLTPQSSAQQPLRQSALQQSQVSTQRLTVSGDLQAQTAALRQQLQAVSGSRPQVSSRAGVQDGRYVSYPPMQTGFTPHRPVQGSIVTGTPVSSQQDRASLGSNAPATGGSGSASARLLAGYRPYSQPYSTVQPASQGLQRPAPSPHMNAVRSRWEFASFVEWTQII